MPITNKQDGAEVRALLNTAIAYADQVPAINTGLALSVKTYEDRAAAAAATIDADVDTIAAMSPGGTIMYYTRSGTGTALTTADGATWKPSGREITPEHFGATGDGSTDDTTSIQAAIDWLESIRGGTLRFTRRYNITARLTVQERGIKLVGIRPERSGANTESALSNGVIICSFTTNPGIWCNEDDFAVEDLTITSSAARTAAALSASGVGTLNAGILLEPPDDGTTMNTVTLRNVQLRGHPGSGWAAEGDVTNVVAENVNTIKNSGHGFSASNGQLSGRSNIGRPGIFTFTNCKSFDNDGNAFAVGHPSDGANTPYRFDFKNVETYRNGLDAAVRHVDAGTYFRGEQITASVSAFAGTNASNAATRPGVYVHGRDIFLDACRYITCATNYVTIFSDGTLGTKNVRIMGGYGGASTPTNFAAITSTAQGVRISNVFHDATNLVDATTSTGLTLETLGTITTYNMTHRDGQNSIGASQSVTIASGVATITRPGLIIVDTESAGATDDLDTVTFASVRAGDVIYLRMADAARVVTAKHATGNLRLHGAADYTMGTQKIVTLYWGGTQWLPLAAPGAV